MSIQTRTTALQNEVVRLYCEFFNDGRLRNPAAQPLVEIIDADGVTVLATIAAAEEHTGVFYADWFVPANLPLGTYYDRWTFQWTSTSSAQELTLDFEVHSFDSYVNFLSPAVSHNVSNRVFQLMKDLSNDFIYEAMHIPIYWEQAMRIQQEHQQKRVNSYFHFTLDSDIYSVEEDTVYFADGQKFTVFQSLYPLYSSSSSSSGDSNSSSSTSESSSSSPYSVSSSSSTSHSSESSTSESSESVGNVSSSDSSSSSSSYPITTTTTTTAWSYQPILTTVGTGVPASSGVLTKVSGTGPDSITYTGFEEVTSRKSTIYSLAYQNWNQSPRPIVRLNNRIIDDGWMVDYNGRIYFDSLMAPEDSVNVAYNFRYFSEEEILSFLDLGLKIMNSTPPASETYSTLVSMPTSWDAPVLLYAAITALKRLIFGLNWQEKFVIFTRPDDPNATQQAIQNFKDLYTDYSTLWMEVKKDAKTRKLPQMAIYVTPEYTLPGGRSRWFRYMFKTGS